MKIFDCVIVGGGASGSICAINLARKGLEVAVVDENLFPAKKLLVTGNGRCNIANLKLDSSHFNQNLDSYFNQFGYEQIADFFKSIGIEIYADSENRCYPITNSAKSVVSAIKNQFDKLNIKFFAQEKFQNFHKKGDFFEIELENSTIFSKKMLICCGGNKVFKCIGAEDIKPFVPSLGALKTQETTRKFEGVRVQNVKVSLLANDKKYIQCGEVLFKDHGLSGICIFNLSSILARNNDFAGKISIDLLPNFSHDETIRLLQTRTEIFESAKDVLVGLVNEKLFSEILLRTGISLETTTKKLTMQNLDKLSQTIHNFEFNICDIYENNQVFSGGIRLDSLTKSLQSKLTDGLFFAGEIVDVDGECGGYNLSWAWTSGAIVAKSIAKTLDW